MKILKSLAFGFILTLGACSLSAQTVTTSKIDSASKANYALLHVYRYGGFHGSFVGYDLHLDKDVICHVKNNWKKTVWTKKEGDVIIWAETEVKSELQISIEKGQEYYIRCRVDNGVVVGRPVLELVDPRVGKIEYAATKQRKANDIDILVLKDGSELECKIISEDNENVYFFMNRDGRKTKTYLGKDQITEIRRGE